jgi:MarR family 2-MHQ and catechol resistance regulon transcriptional repressor
MKNHSLLTKKEISKKMIHNILVTNSWINEKSNFFFKKFNLSLQQYNVLQVLMEKQEESYALGDIQIRMLSKMSNTTRLVGQLEKKGLATRSRNLKNRRKVNITITSEGVKLFHQLEKELNQLKKQTTEQLTKVEALILNRLLEKLKDT